MPLSRPESFGLPTETPAYTFFDAAIESGRPITVVDDGGEARRLTIIEGWRDDKPWIAVEPDNPNSVLVPPVACYIGLAEGDPNPLLIVLNYEAGLFSCSYVQGPNGLDETKDV